jgi:hypothetical protein
MKGMSAKIYRFNVLSGTEERALHSAQGVAVYGKKDVGRYS